MSEKLVTYYVVLPFKRGKRGHLVADQPFEAPSAHAATRRVQRLGEAGGGGIAFSRTGDPAMGDWQDAVILASTEGIPPEAIEAVQAA